MRDRILIVEDEVSMAGAISYALRQEGFETVVAHDGRKALEVFRKQPPDLVLLDIMVPEVSGWQLLPAFRRSSNVPVIIVSARVQEADRVSGLELGADDYVTKPFSPRELVARVRAVLRRARAEAEATEARPVSLCGVELEPERREARVDGNPVGLSRKEFDLLLYLMLHAGRVRTREEILKAVWGQDEYIDQRTVDVHIRWLRKKIEANPAVPRRLITVRGVGYRFADAL